MKCRVFVFCLCLGLALLAACSQKTDPTHPFIAIANHDYFVQYVKPVLQARCLACHRGSEPPAGLSLVQRSSLYAPRRYGRAFVVPGDPHASRLLTSVSVGGYHPGQSLGPLLTAAETDVLYEWIEDGAHWPDNPDGFLQPWVYLPRKKGLLER
ncbi:c-type cytochrome domain-containing protein [Prosthecobacter sp.]|uniref:c-type cytochrome domain-containing protein n=1 Tax=Prosthecobacter sp. TaxID=1965333 RepID=UPI0037847343